MDNKSIHIKENITNLFYHIVCNVKLQRQNQLKSIKMKKKYGILKAFYLLVIILSCNIMSYAQTGSYKETRKISSIPFSLEELNSPINIKIKKDSLVIIAKGKTNLFNNPGGNFSKQNAPMLLFHPDSNFIFTAKVQADLKEIYDVAALVLYQDKNTWAKLCYENSVKKRATVVSVVTNKYSDDCNSIETENNYIYFAIAKKDNEISFHCSLDNVHWNLVRHFHMNFDNEKLKVGFAVHCSKGDKFMAEFSNINYSKNSLEKMRTYK